MQSELDFSQLEQNALTALKHRLGVKATDLPRGMKRAVVGFPVMRTARLR